MGVVISTTLRCSQEILPQVLAGRDSLGTRAITRATKTRKPVNGAPAARLHLVFFRSEVRLVALKSRSRRIKKPPIFDVSSGFRKFQSVGLGSNRVSFL